jgi:hypothetical protein
MEKDKPILAKLISKDSEHFIATTFTILGRSDKIQKDSTLLGIIIL